MELKGGNSHVARGNAEYQTNCVNPKNRFPRSINSSCGTPIRTTTKPKRKKNEKNNTNNPNPTTNRL